MPFKGDEVAVIPTHVFAADKIFVQLIDCVKRFEDFQYIAVQKVQLKQLSYIPSKKKFDCLCFDCTLLMHGNIL